MTILKRRDCLNRLWVFTVFRNPTIEASTNLYYEETAFAGCLLGYWCSTVGYRRDFKLFGYLLTAQPHESSFYFVQTIVFSAADAFRHASH